ncbi:MAG: antibiotic biosynthesis monooxygenase [Actinobacteria bacterium]|nr:antibiotic biosynthesis monooxygenase [Actinomycetota bacterium]
MIVEVAQFEVNERDHAEFQAVLNSAIQTILFKAKGFIDCQVLQGIENPAMFSLHIRWERLEDHMVTFREGELFQLWRGEIGRFFVSAPHVVHANPLNTFTR